MSREDSGDEPGEYEEFVEKELIDAEFESMVGGFYLDELDSFADLNRFTPPVVPKKSFLEELRSAQQAFIRWKNNRQNQNPEDGATL